VESLVGKVVGGCQVEAEIGRGGMGVVYRARQLSLDRDVALKILSPVLSSNEKLVERFEHEARAIAKINHPNILAIYDVGWDATNRVHYMVIELIDGRALAENLEERGLLPAKEALEIMYQASLGLARAEQAGIVHRDIKPENIMVTADGMAKVTDFGLAKEVQASLTATDGVMGTPAYMSPEQCEGLPLDVRTDIYSLGGAFYRIVTGRLPFEGESAMAVMYKHKHEPLVPPIDVVPHIPQTLSDIIVNMMEKEREDRPGSMADVAQLLEQLRRELPLLEELRTTMQVPAQPADTRPLPRQRAAGMPVPQRPGSSASILRPPPGVPPSRRTTPVAVPPSRAISGGAPAIGPLRARTGARDVTADATRLREMANQQVARGALAEAGRTLRALVEMEPDNMDARRLMAEVETRLQRKRKLLNDLRLLINTSRFKEAVAMWDQMEPWQREEGLGRQIAILRDNTIPVAGLNAEADALREKGALEEAIAKYEEAHVLDPENEKARQGIKDAENKLRRIDIWLREGYERAMRQEYAAAIEIWSKIFGVSPEYREARNRIIQAHLDWGHSLRGGRGGLRGGVEQWKAVLALDPEHRVAKRLHKEDAGRLKQLMALEEEAKEAKKRGRLGRAARAWKKMLALDPNQQTAVLELRLCRRRLRVQRVARNFVVLLATALLLLAIQVYYERDALSTLREQHGSGDLTRANDFVSEIERRTTERPLGRFFLGRIWILGRPWWPASKANDLWWEDIRRDVVWDHAWRRFESQREDGLREEEGGRWREAGAKLGAAVRTLEQLSGDLVPILPEEDRPEKRKIIGEEFRELGFRRDRARGRAAEAAEDWEGACDAYRRAADGAGPLRLEGEAENLRRRSNFFATLLLARTHEAAGLETEAMCAYIECWRLFPDEEIIRAALKKRGLSPPKARTPSAPVRARRERGGRADEETTRLIRLLREAVRLDPTLEESTQQIEFYLRHARWCSEREMVLVASTDPLKGWPPKPEEGRTV